MRANTFVTLFAGSGSASAGRDLAWHKAFAWRGYRLGWYVAGVKSGSSHHVQPSGIATNVSPGDASNDDQDLRETLGLDSVDVVGLVMRIEREFRVRLSPEELANVKVVGDLLGLMETKLAERPDLPADGA